MTTPPPSKDAPPSSTAERTLPLEAKVEPAAGGWSIRLPLRAEEVTVDKRTVVAETLTVRRGQVKEVMHRDEMIRRERLRIESEGNLEVTRPIDPSRAPAGDTEWTRLNP
jgi:stress response protein YsnF